MNPITTKINADFVDSENGLRKVNSFNPITKQELIEYIETIIINAQLDKAVGMFKCTHEGAESEFNTDFKKFEKFCYDCGKFV